MELCADRDVGKRHHQRQGGGPNGNSHFCRDRLFQIPTADSQPSVSFSTAPRVLRKKQLDFLTDFSTAQRAHNSPADSR